MDVETGAKKENSIPSFECYCEYEKKYQVEFDGGDSGKYVVNYCQICYDQDDKQFMISVKGLER